MRAVAEKITAAAIRISLCDESGIQQGGVELLDAWSRDSDQRLWIDIESAEKGGIEPLLEERFGFHELAAEDAVSPNTLPKYDSFPGYDFFVFRSIDAQIETHRVQTTKLACFLGGNFLFTIHRGPLSAVDNVWKRLVQDRRLALRGMDYLLHTVLDGMVDSHFPLLERIEERTDEIHELIFEEPSPELLDELLKFKRDLNVIRRHSLPQRELFNQLSRGDAQFISRDHLIYFRDLYDHMFRIAESIDVERDLTASTMEAYLSVVANRTNDIMKVLTIISTVLLPVNFIAGVYGMNFVHMPELHWHYGYLWAYCLMLVIASVMLLGFWKNGWIGSSRAKRRARSVAEHRLQSADPPDDAPEIS
jgi:magnesium transporter